MANIKYMICFIGLTAGLSASAQEKPINLAGPKDQVIRVETRQNVLNVAEHHLNTAADPDGFVDRVILMPNPFTFEQPVAETAPASVEAVAPAPEPVVYDDASVLKAVASSFSTQVRGNLSRGTTRYLQLEGGALMKEGSRFPARLPEVEGETFQVTLSEIGSNGYTLRIGEAEMYLPYGGAPSASSGASRDTP